MAEERPTIEIIREAFLKIHNVAIGRSDRAYMSIPADPTRDADLIMGAAIDELGELRRENAGLRMVLRHHWNGNCEGTEKEISQAVEQALAATQ